MRIPGPERSLDVDLNRLVEAVRVARHQIRTSPENVLAAAKELAVISAAKPPMMIPVSRGLLLLLDAYAQANSVAILLRVDPRAKAAIRALDSLEEFLLAIQGQLKEPLNHKERKADSLLTRLLDPDPVMDLLLVADLDAVPASVVSDLMNALDGMHRALGGGGLVIRTVHTGSVASAEVAV